MEGKDGREIEGWTRMDEEQRGEDTFAPDASLLTYLLISDSLSVYQSIPLFLTFCIIKVYSLVSNFFFVIFRSHLLFQVVSFKMSNSLSV